MTKLIAIHYLHLAASVDGLVDLVEPGQAFTPREDELYLADGPAARPATADDANAKLAKRHGASGAAAVAEELSKLTKAQLIALAAAEEIVIDDKATNAVIIATIEAARAAKNEAVI